jgi:hypothetical protein
MGCTVTCGVADRSRLDEVEPVRDTGDFARVDMVTRLFL